MEVFRTTLKFVEIIPAKFLKHVEGTKGLYEIRVSGWMTEVRIFCILDKDCIIILLNCYIKKSEKAPKEVIKKASKLQEEYLKNLKNE